MDTQDLTIQEDGPRQQDFDSGLAGPINSMTEEMVGQIPGMVISGVISLMPMLSFTIKQATIPIHDIPALVFNPMKPTLLAVA